ncbi:MAG: hypothetical protein A3D13_01070 [Planctomycetes bacterium RIFCSPHIGHO2_02_FULL_40_12]|nr:MAG: hypothetical protein A3D13_01070 [Planctomycetes bacterium RIFCSPHIGHO2_02_FULL_40_12]OHC03492.1 MAG: hypothetical protein A3H23_09005 [Planctomycetes bacterium RIFCSPLOWO2_12_FULL_40_19]
MKEHIVSYIQNKGAEIVRLAIELIDANTVDNKGQMASMLALAKLLKDNESKLNGSLLLIGASDEEKGIIAVDLTLAMKINRMLQTNL